MARPVPVNFQANIVRQYRGAIVVATAALIGGAARGATKELPTIVQSLGKALDLKKIPRDRLKAVNQRIAEGAQDRVVEGWKARLPRRTEEGSSKRLTGLLGPALADRANTQATSDRVIAFADAKVLGREARHWYRVNYGAKGSNLAKGRSARRFVMTLNGATFGSFIDDLPPDPISYLPYRFYWRGDNLFPRKSKQSSAPKVVVNPNGARAARFLELGHAYVTRNAPREHDKLWRGYLNERGGAARSRLAKVDINMVGDLRLERTSWSARVRKR